MSRNGGGFWLINKTCKCAIRTDDGNLERQGEEERRRQTIIFQIANLSAMAEVNERKVIYCLLCFSLGA
jgi:hypothetical protein